MPSSAGAAASASSSSCSRTTTRRPSTGFIVCDRDARVLAAGRGVFELTGFQEGDLMGRDVGEVLSLSDPAPIGVVREWGVRQLGLELELTTQRRDPQARHGRPLPRLRRGRRAAGRADAADAEPDRPA